MELSTSRRLLLKESRRCYLRLTRQSGLEPGYRVNTDSRAALSSKHVSAITNRGGATATEIMELASCGARWGGGKFGISLVPEPVLVGLEGLD